MSDAPSLTTTLDIFNLRDEVIADYRRYIESFLKIRDPRVEGCAGWKCGSARLKHCVVDLE